MAGFEAAFDIIIGHEGGYVNDPADPGGETKYGISKRAYPDLDIAALELADARDIYRADYWDACRCDELPPALALAVFDAAVNQGVAAAGRFLQRAVGASADGVIGPNTLAAAGRAGEAALGHLLAERALHYASLPTFARFGRGWMRRLFETHARALAAAG
jgi:lysozyme family protein